MSRSGRLLALALAAAIFPAASALAEDPKPAPAGDAKAAPKPPALATDEEADAALLAFKEEWKAKGLKGKEKELQRAWAMEKLSKVNHPSVVDALAEVSRGGDAKLRATAVLYLSEQKALPGPAGRAALAALERNKKDFVLLFSSLDTIGSVRYLGAGDSLRELMKGDNFTVRKAAIVAAGKTGDVRLLPDLLKLLGIDAKEDGGGDDKEVVVTEGYSWEGAEASVDTGTAGDADQQAAEAAVAAQLAANEAAAAAAAGAGGGGSGGGATTRGKGGAARSIKELAPHILKAVQQITGQKFATGKAIAEWLKANRAWLAEERARVAEAAKAQ
jgi:HEAT repeat protein